MGVVRVVVDIFFHSFLYKQSLSSVIYMFKFFFNSSLPFLSTSSLPIFSSSTSFLAILIIYLAIFLPFLFFSHFDFLYYQRHSIALFFSSFTSSSSFYFVLPFASFSTTLNSLLFSYLLFHLSPFFFSTISSMSLLSIISFFFSLSSSLFPLPVSF